MLRIGICDDSAEARLSLHAMLERLLEKRGMKQMEKLENAGQSGKEGA